MDNATAVQKQPFKLDIDETIKAQAEAYAYPNFPKTPNETTVEAIRNFANGAKLHEGGCVPKVVDLSKVRIN